MKNYEEVVLLKIMTYDGIIEIPFISLKELDRFTIKYKDKDTLIKSLLAMLNLSIKKERVIDIYVYYEYERNNQIRRKNARVMYSEHNFDETKLSGYLKEFLDNNHDAIHYSGVRKIRSVGMFNFLNGYRDIERYEINHAVDEYFRGAPYGVYRKNYFFLLENGVKPAVKRVVREDDSTISRDLSKFHSDDEFVQSMLRRAQDDDDYDKVYEELSKIELEELSNILTNSHFGLFDGTSNDRPYTLEDLYDLEQCTGMNIEDLCACVANFKKNGFRR